jgi:hypothetical protein
LVGLQKGASDFDFSEREKPPFGSCELLHHHPLSIEASQKDRYPRYIRWHENEKRSSARLRSDLLRL